MPSSEISFDREGIANLLHASLLKVPKYQREFKWEEEHVRELFNDIENAIADPQPEYFLGSIVISKGGSERPDIVDGQQRLATVSISIYGHTAQQPEHNRRGANHQKRHRSRIHERPTEV